MFDTCNLASGVTLIEGGRVKRGHNKHDVTTLDELGNGGKIIRMSQFEYQRLTHAGNLSRSSLYQTGDFSNMRKSLPQLKNVDIEQALIKEEMEGDEGEAED